MKIPTAMRRITRLTSALAAAALITGLGLAACNTGKPREGALGLVERVDKRLRGLGYEPYVGSFADAGGFLKRQIDTWGQLIRATGISPE